MKLLYRPETINDIIKYLTFKIAQDYGQICETQGSITVVPILKAAFIFAADFVRSFPVKNVIQVEFVGVSSYKGTTQGDLLLTLSPHPNAIHNKHVLVLDTIYDSGRTMNYIVNEINDMGSASVKTCCLINKNETSSPDYYGLRCDKDTFIIGYGTDCDELFRDRDGIYVKE